MLHTEGHAEPCHTVDISAGGMRITSGVRVSPGTAFEITLCIGEICNLHVSGRTVSCSGPGANGDTCHTVGVAFSAIRDWEQIIILSALKELRQTLPARDRSLVTITAARDQHAVAAEQLRGPASVVEPDGGTAERRPSNADSSRPSGPSPEDTLVSTSPSSRIGSPHDVDIPTFTLSVNGKDLDTGLYKYSFRADKLISERQAVQHVARQLKQGLIPSRANEYVFAKYCVGRRDTNLAAMQAAYAASRAYRVFPLSTRLQIAADIHRLLVEHKHQLIELMVNEGHPIQLAEWEFSGMEQAYNRDSLEFYRQHLRTRIGGEGPEAFYLTRKPDGVVGVCPPRNAPCSSSLIAGFALLAGNTLIVKPPLAKPVSTMFLWKHIVQRALEINHAPRGTVNIVLGNSSVILDEWITQQFVNDILFIGDSSTGGLIGQRAFQSGKKPILELSGNDMMFVWRDADIAAAVESLLDGFMGSTQVCMVPKKAYIHEDVYPAFEKRFLDAVKGLKVGLPSDPDVILTPVNKIGEFHEFLIDAIEHGAHLLCGGARINHRGAPDQDGPFISPAVLRITDGAKTKDMRCIREENFFPLIPLIRVSGEEFGSRVDHRDELIFRKMVAAANTNAYGMRVSVWVRSEDYIEKFADHIQNSGIVRINCRHIGFSPRLATHGGTGKSGGPFGELNYVWQKTSHLQGIALTRNNQSSE